MTLSIIPKSSQQKQKKKQLLEDCRLLISFILLDCILPIKRASPCQKILSEEILWKNTSKQHSFSCIKD